MEIIKYTTTDYYTLDFYRIPKLFEYDEKYRYISPAAKYLYAVMLNRHELSMKNNWIDNDNYIYFYLTIENIMHFLNESVKSATKHRNELIKANLLQSVRVGINKPNRLYLLKPINSGHVNITSQDMYKVQGSYKESSYKELNTYIFPAERRFSISNDIIQTIDDYCWERFNRHVQWKKENFDFDILEEIYQYYGTSAIEEIMNERINKISKCSLEYIESIQIAYEGYDFD